MKHRVLIFVTLAMFQLAIADSEDFATGDHLFVKAQIVDCGPQKRFVEVGIVEENGQVALFDDVLLETKGKTRPEIMAQLVDGLEQRTGQRPTTIEILRVPADNPEKAAHMMIMIQSERQPGCRKELVPDSRPPAKEWFRIAHNSPHNKALKSLALLRRYVD